MRTPKSRSHGSFLTLLFLAAIMTGCSHSNQSATLVIHGPRVWTGDADNRWAEAVAARDGRIVFVGDWSGAQKYVGPETQVLHRTEGLITPGFTDCHVHLLSGGESLAAVQLRDASSKDEFVKRIAIFARTHPKGEWIVAGDWDHTLWGGELPTRQWIDSVTPDHPVFVSRLDGHMCLANSNALRLAGVDSKTADVEGGAIVRDADGHPTGILKDNAIGLVSEVMPRASDEVEDRVLEAAMADLASVGVTAVHDMGSGGYDDLETYQRAAAAGRLKTRIYSMQPLRSWKKLAERVERDGTGDEWLRIGGLKGFADGSLGSHTAHFHEDYDDKPNAHGLQVTPPSELRADILGAESKGLHVMVHAIGDRAISDLLDIYAAVNQDAATRDRRHRIEHAQHIRPSDIERFSKLGVIASMQPNHLTDDGRWAAPLIGDQRCDTTYAFRDLINSGAEVVFGSDWPVASASPLLAIDAAVTRRTSDGKNPDGWIPRQKITVEEALRAFTTKAALASFDEGNRGCLKVGMLADFVLISHDIFRIPPASIRDSHVLLTVVDGQIVFSADN